MLTEFRRLLAGCDISDAQFFLDNLFGTHDFTTCDNIDKLLHQLSDGYIDTLNVYSLKQLAACLKKAKFMELVEEYEKKVQKFLEETTVLDFHKAVISKAKPVVPEGIAEISIKIPRRLATKRILKDMEELAMNAFEDNQQSFVRFHAFSGSVVISWFMPNKLCARMEELAEKKALMLKTQGVLEVTIGGKSVFPIRNSG